MTTDYQQPPDVPFTPLSEYEEFFLIMLIAEAQLHGEPASEAEFEQRHEKVVERIRHFWPLYYYQQHGIGMGGQWDMLGQLAWYYARDFTDNRLADHLWKVMEASPQDPRHPKGLWRHSEAQAIADRAVRNRAEADAAWDRWYHESGAYAWAMSTVRWAQSQGRPRQAREPGTRKAGTR